MPESLIVSVGSYGCCESGIVEVVFNFLFFRGNVSLGRLLLVLRLVLGLGLVGLLIFRFATFLVGL